MNIPEERALRYAQQVHKALLDDFPHLQGESRMLIVWEMVARQAESPSPAFELILDEQVAVGNWYLLPGDPPNRVQVACAKVRPSHAQTRREERLNAALRAIALED